MQILVLYFSKGGNTRKLADAVARGVEEVEGVNVLLKHTGEVSKDDFLESQGINGMVLLRCREVVRFAGWTNDYANSK